jgi:hypothetical protein
MARPVIFTISAAWDDEAQFCGTDQDSQPSYRQRHLAQAGLPKAF